MSLQLYPYQRTGVTWLCARKRALLADSCGVGKSAQLINAINTPSALIICPASIKYNWMHELQLWDSPLNTTIIKSKSEFSFPLPGEAVVSNYELVNPAVIDPATPTTLIVDECHCLRNRDTQKAKRIRKIVERLHPDSFVYGVTGTPMVNHPGELWAVLYSLGLEDQTWPREYMMQLDFNVDRKPHAKWGFPSTAALTTLNSVMLRRETETVLSDMPERRWRTIQVDPDSILNYNKLELLMDDASDRLEQYLALQPPDKEDTNLPPMPEIARVRAQMAMAKLPAAEQIIEDLEAQGEQLVVFCAYKEPVEILGKREGWTYITGDVSDTERHKRTMAFQAKQYRGIALTIGAGREGINLHSSNQLLFIDLDWTPAANIQAEGRIYRNGQRNACLYTTLVIDHPLDRRLAQILWRKEVLFRATIKESRGAAA
jgi:SNF2 family DNA or RNA helicase